MFIVSRKLENSTIIVSTIKLRSGDKILTASSYVLEMFYKGGDNGYKDVIRKLELPEQSLKSVKHIIDKDVFIRISNSEAGKYLKKT